MDQGTAMLAALLEKSMNRGPEWTLADAGFRTVTSDMSPSFAAGVSARMPRAMRIIDKFHAMQPFSRAIDQVRTAECRESKEKKNLIKRSRLIWLKNPGGLTDKQRKRKESLSKEHLKTARVCAMKEAMQSVYECASKAEAAESPDRLISWMTHSRLEPMKSVAGTLKGNR
jgi:transposase